MTEQIEIREERISAGEYIAFLKRTDLGSQYSRERFSERIETLVKNTSISLIARNESGMIVGVLFRDHGLCILAVFDRSRDRQSI